MDAQKLLEQFLGPGGLSQHAQRARDMLRGASGEGGGLSGMLGQLGGMLGGKQEQSPAPGGSQSRADAPSQGGGLDHLMNNIPGGATGAFAGAGLLAVLLGQKSVRKMAGGLMSVGASAALGALAYRAWQNWNTGQPLTAAPIATPADAPAEDSPFLPKADATGQPFALALIKAMIAAANADGHIGPEEHKQIFDAANRAGFDPDAKAFIFDALANPPSVRQIASMASGMEQSAELYLAARLAIDPDEPSEKAFLEALAQAMSLPPQFVAHLEQQVTGGGV
ncbi:MAG: tellurite resistance TerB family protein [Beijerinckiaceae bacterium]|nr:tellurite resistance TerB family protein [Beijerinckiaceae bacterium]